jgi:hypothetical protein
MFLEVVMELPFTEEFYSYFAKGQIYHQKHDFETPYDPAVEGRTLTGISVN